MCTHSWAEIEGAFHAHGGLLVLRGQEAHCGNPHAVTSFAARFGSLEDNEKYFQMGLEAQLHPEIPEILSVGNALGDNSMMIKVDPEVTIAHAKRGELEGCVAQRPFPAPNAALVHTGSTPTHASLWRGRWRAFQRCVRRTHAGGANVALR